MRKIILYLVYAMIAASVILAFALLFPAYNDLKKMKARITEIEQELEKRKTEAMELRQLLLELETNPKAIEKIAREKYNLCKPDDVIYKYGKADLQNSGQ